MSEKSLKVVCVVVTYNRIALLKECVESLMRQTFQLSKIIIVDNHSSDDTCDYLSELSDNSLFQIVTMSENVGGAGGFSEGIKQAAHAHADWIWLMDDDTILRQDSLQRLLPYTQIENLGYVGSMAIWKDGTPHKMNLPRLSPNQTIKEQWSLPEGISLENFDLVDSASFVSLLVRGTIPWQIGLPYKEFFIWCDDAEYTERICLNGYYGIWAKDSVVLHKTQENYVPSLKNMPSSEAWKLYYGIRNNSFLRRRHKGWLLFIIAQLNCFRTHAHRIKQRHLPKEEEKFLLEANNRGLRDGFTFRPQIEYLE